MSDLIGFDDCPPASYVRHTAPTSKATRQHPSVTTPVIPAPVARRVGTLQQLRQQIPATTATREAIPANRPTRPERDAFRAGELRELVDGVHALEPDFEPTHDTTLGFAFREAIARHGAIAGVRL